AALVRRRRERDALARLFRAWATSAARSSRSRTRLHTAASALRSALARWRAADATRAFNQWRAVTAAQWQREQRQFQRLWKVRRRRGWQRHTRHLSTAAVRASRQLEANSMSPASPYAAPSAHAGASTGGAQSDASSDEQASGGGGGGGDDSTDSDGGYAAMAGLLHAEGEAELGG
ncbi:MAG: hypothetical protein ACK4YT_14150, partial [Sphingomonas sp.]